jgi:hypothetical protein
MTGTSRHGCGGVLSAGPRGEDRGREDVVFLKWRSPGHRLRRARTGPMGWHLRPQAMTKMRSQELSEKANEEQRRCRDWLLPFMRGNQPKFLD